MIARRISAPEHAPIDVWTQLAADASPSLPLRLSSFGATATSARVRSTFSFSPAALQAVGAAARAHRVSERVVLVALFAALLHRYSDDSPILVAQTTDSETFSLLRVELADDPLFGDLVGEVAAEMARGAETAVPAALLKERELPAHVVFSWSERSQREERDSAVLPGAVATLRCRRTAAKLRCVLEFSGDVADDAGVARFAAHLQTAASSLDDLAATVRTLPLLTPNEREQQARWNATETRYDRHRTLVGEVRRHAAIAPDDVAVACDDETLTYAQLDTRANALATVLRARGVAPGVLVAVFVERSVDMLVAVVGIHAAGGAYVPIDPSYPEERIGFMLSDSQAPVVVTQERLRGVLPRLPVEVVTLEQAANAAPDVIPFEPDPHHLAYVIYTSGSTGRPKGVLIEHGNVANLLAGIEPAIPIGRGDTLVALAPLSFDMSVLDVYLPLANGARMVVATRETATNPRALIALMQRCGVTHMQATPSTWRMLIDAGWSGMRGLTAVTGGEAVPAPLAAQLLERVDRLWNLYGPTEATVWATIHRITTDDPTTIGTPLANVRTRILDPHGHPLPVGITGELHLGGDGLARGYLNRPELTAERFIADPIDSQSRLYRTGDLGRYRDDGCIEYLGRNDFQVKLRGHRIELGEVEDALTSQPGVRSAVAIVREDVPGDPRLIGYVAVGSNTDIAAPTLRRALLRSLPAYMVPDSVVVLDDLPLNDNGKVDRKRLPLPAGRAHESGGVAPRTPLEARLLEIWEEVLDLRPIGVTDDFFDLGATSITAARVFERIERELGASLPISPLFQAPTIERLAELIEAGRAQRRWTSLVPIQPLGTKTPIFCVHGGAGTILHFQPLARRLGTDQPFYGLQMQGLYGDAPPHLTVEAMAKHYIREIRSVQPHGPYRIFGYCFGGIVAFEIVRQLRRAGEDVSVLVSINGPSPEYIRTKGGPGGQRDADAKLPPVRGPRAQAILLAKRAYWKLRWELGEGRPTRWLDLRTHVCARLRRPLPDGWRRLAIYRICWRAERRYRPYAVDVPVVVFAAEGLYRSSDLGWAPYAAGGITTFEVPGRHRNQREAMAEPHAGFLAERLHDVFAAGA
ncbi:MAG TPA: amino acid adenylation domain-containing protein [Candidatus Acidoferrum sp.]|nr:amino acid adenylation domain-containing protein [Candidatus Acidoferrum sp.]